jgi:hypothetical protein
VLSIKEVFLNGLILASVAHNANRSLLSSSTLKVNKELTNENQEQVVFDLG